MPRRRCQQVAACDQLLISIQVFTTAISNIKPFQILGTLFLNRTSEPELYSSGSGGYPMALTEHSEPDPESSLLLGSSPATNDKIPEDKFHFVYVIYFTLGLGYLLPWNAFITAVDYFSYLYPEASVDRVFAVVYMLVGLVCILVIILYSHKSDAYVRINVGLGVFVISLLIVPIMDAAYLKGRVGLYDGFYVTVGAVGLSGVADALVQGGIVGAAGELPERYMQAVVAGTAASGSASFRLKVFSYSVFIPRILNNFYITSHRNLRFVKHLSISYKQNFHVIFNA